MTSKDPLLATAVVTGPTVTTVDVVTQGQEPAEKKECVFKATICCYTTLRSPGSCLVGCHHKQELCCCLYESCLAINGESKGCGCIEKEGDYAAVCCGPKCVCCQCGLKSPELCCAGESDQCCCRGVQSFPFDDRFVAKPVCAICCLQCFPECGCCAPPPVRASSVGGVVSYGVGSMER